MSGIAIAGAGAFGTALAIALSEGGRKTTLWARDQDTAADMQKAHLNRRYLPEIPFPDGLAVSSETAALERADAVLLAIPTQNIRAFTNLHRTILSNKTCILCCKGIEAGSGLLPSQIVASLLPGAKTAVLTGPGFASEIARGLPTALTLAMTGGRAAEFQALLSTKTLRLYLSDDLTGAQLGGALKNVIAIACGIAIGAGLGESARAALMTRGYAEIRRLAVDMGAKPATLSGLSGLGDLALTCSSAKSRNFSLGLDLGLGQTIPTGPTFEGVATARACLTLARSRDIDMPIAEIVAAVLEHSLTIPEATSALLSRPLKSEI